MNLLCLLKLCYNNNNSNNDKDINISFQKNKVKGYGKDLWLVSICHFLTGSRDLKSLSHQKMKVVQVPKVRRLAEFTGRRIQNMRRF